MITLNKQSADVMSRCQKQKNKKKKRKKEVVLVFNAGKNVKHSSKVGLHRTAEK